MVEQIYNMKNAILKQAEKELEERGPDRMDVDRLGEMIDMVKDLAEAEKSCWEAQYYRSAVTESMEKKYGYSGMPGANAQSGRMGYGNMGYGTMGYGSLIDKIGEEYRNLPPEERVTMKSQILTKLGSM